MQACYHKEKMWGSKREEWGTNASSTTVEVVASRLVTEFPNAAFEFRRLFGHVLLSSNGAGDPRKRHNIEDATYNCCTITYNTSKFLTVMYNLTHEILSLVATRDHVPR